LQDKAPDDYAKAVRVFPETAKARLRVSVVPLQVGHGALDIELLNYKGQRPVRIKIDGKSGKVLANNRENMTEVASFSANEPLRFSIAVDAAAGRYDMSVNDNGYASFTETLTNADNPYKSKFDTPTVERIVFRTGPYRQKDFSRYGFGANDYRKNEPDLPAPDEPVANAVFDIDNLRTVSAKP
jgi:hypothetical protein